MPPQNAIFVWLAIAALLIALGLYSLLVNGGGY
jgi:heme exporter protein D